VVRTGKRVGTYRALGQKLEFSFGATDDLSLSFALLGDHHRVRAIPGFDDIRGRYAFNGFGAELRWRLLDRKTSPFGLTLQLEPGVGRIDEILGRPDAFSGPRTSSSSTASSSPTRCSAP
jgi:hypothetical protein